MLSRRELLRILGALPAAYALRPGRIYAEAAAKLPRRLLGRTGFQAVPLALGGLASLHLPRPGLDAADIIVRAALLGMNYLETAKRLRPQPDVLRRGLPPAAPNAIGPQLQPRLAAKSRRGQQNQCPLRCQSQSAA